MRWHHILLCLLILPQFSAVFLTEVHAAKPRGVAVLLVGAPPEQPYPTVLRGTDPYAEAMRGLQQVAMERAKLDYRFTDSGREGRVSAADLNSAYGGDAQAASRDEFLQQKWDEAEYELAVTVAESGVKLPAALNFGLRPIPARVRLEWALCRRSDGQTVSSGSTPMLVEEAQSRVLVFGKRKPLARAALRTAYQRAAVRLVEDVEHFLLYGARQWPKQLP